MSVKSFLKRGLFGAFNFKRMLGFDTLKDQAKSVKSLYENAYSKDQPTGEYKPASFEDCLRHYGVSEDALKQRMRNTLLTVYFCLSLAVIVIGYSIYQFMSHFTLGGLMCVVLALILLVMAFREHFNWYQMKQRRLGCTIKEWFLYLIKRSK